MPSLNMIDDRLLHALAAFRTPRRICQGTHVMTVPKPAQSMRQSRAAHHERECCEDGQHYGSDAQVIGPRRPVAACAVGLAVPSPAGRARVAQPSLVSLRALSLEVSVGAEQIHVVELGESEGPVWRDVEKQVGGLAFLADSCAGCRCRRTLQTAVAGRLRVALVDLKARFRSDTAGLRLIPAPVRKSLLRSSGRASSPSRQEQQSEFMCQLNEVCRAFYPDLHRCACQWPGLGTTIFFPGQKPLSDGHGVHSLPPPPRKYEPSWQGRH